jgi:methionyl aminopeptidase
MSRKQKSKQIPYTEKEIEILKEGGKRLHQILLELGEMCKAGISGLELDKYAEKRILELGDIPVFKNYKPHGAAYAFPATLCISVNHVVAHGIPDEKKIENGDIVSMDLGLRHAGLVVDSAITVIVGGDENAKSTREIKLLEVTKKALEIGIAKCKVGNDIQEVGIAIEDYVKGEGYEVVDILCGHAVGREVHSEPLIPHVDMDEWGDKFTEGMVVAIEPHISMGSGQVSLHTDAWAYVADDEAKSAQFEHTVLITKDGPVILT